MVHMSRGIGFYIYSFFTAVAVFIFGCQLFMLMSASFMSAIVLSNYECYWVLTIYKYINTIFSLPLFV